MFPHEPWDRAGPIPASSAIVQGFMINFPEESFSPIREELAGTVKQMIVLHSLYNLYFLIW